MFEVDFLPVGNGDKSGDAIALRYTNPDGPGYIIGVVDAGFTENGDAIVEHINNHYETSSVDFVLSTHPDEDHINGMGTVMGELDVGTLLIHRPAQHGYPNNSGSRPAEDLAGLATQQGAKVIEPFAGVYGFGGTLLIAGPTAEFYEEMLAGQSELA